MKGSVASVNVSSEKSVKKAPVPEAVLVAGHGIDGDAHAGGEKQVSLLAIESVEGAAESIPGLGPGDFGENMTTRGIDVVRLPIGTRLAVGAESILQISGIGKVCQTPCSIGQRLGDCVMPREGVFAKVAHGGRVWPGDAIEVTSVKAGAVVTSSDRCSRGEREDESGPLLAGLLEELGVVLADYAVLPDEEAELSAKLCYLADRCSVDVVLTTGGTGFSPRDRTPEATLAVLDGPAAGISEALRAEGMRNTPNACLSRGVSGLRGRTLIVNLPGSRRAVEQSLGLLRTILPHVLEVIRGEAGDCGPAI